MAGEPPLALACLSRRPGAFGAADLHLLGRIARISGPALERLRLARRNALLAGMIHGTVPPDRAPGLFDAPLEAASRAVDRLTRAQAAAVEITNDLLRAPSDGVDAAIDMALARTGALAGSDRTYVFHLRPPDRLDNSHEWTAPGIAPMIAELQDMPVDLMAPWHPAFDADREVYIPDVAALPVGNPIRAVLEMQEIRSLLAVPMRQDGRLTGLVGHDAVRAPRSFLPGEIFLLRSVANAINSVRFMAMGEQYAPVDFLTATEEAPPAHPLARRLRGRELQMLEGLCAGKSNREIARDLSLTEPTIRLHMKPLYRKLDAHNRTQAALIAKEAELF